jgi:dTDP-4-amino-4,6-dideoxygalactose transaminase
LSFNGNKIITTGGGGMLCSNDEDLVARCRFLATQARDPAPHYQHSTIGYNYRMTSMAAAIGLRQFEVLPDRVARKRRIFETYRSLLADLPGIDFMPEASYGQSNRWLTVVQIDAEKFGATPETVRTRLEAERIESRPVWKPLHLQPVFSKTSCAGGKVAEEIFRKGLCLPSGTAMTEDDIQRVCRIVRGCRGLEQRAGRRVA